MHAAAYAAFGIEAVYQLLPIPPALFEETVGALPDSGFYGINVTIPHKEAALRVAATADAAAEATGAANTLTFEGGAIHAANTDAPALTEALAQFGPTSEALVLGAGGTARAAIWALRDGGAEVTVWNRTAQRARRLADELGVTAIEALPETLREWPVVVNCTAVGMSADDAELVEPRQLEAVETVVDFVYGSERTALARAAEAAGCNVVEGPELLARQGALSFARWFDVEPPLAQMLAALRE
jgi:shikimate dehydrogenase